MMKKTINSIRHFFPSIIFAFLIFLISNQQNIKLPDIGFDLIDKFMHLFAYLIFGLTLIYGIYKSVNLSSIKEFFILFTFGSVYAITDEIHQYFVPGRTCDIFDILADITGIVLSYFIFYLLNIIIITIKAKFV